METLRSRISTVARRDPIEASGPGASTRGASGSFVAFTQRIPETPQRLLEPSESPAQSGPKGGPNKPKEVTDPVTSPCASQRLSAVPEVGLEPTRF